MKNCPACRRPLERSLRDACRYTETGLGNVYLRNVEVMQCDCGESVLLRSQPTLLRIIAKCFAFKPARIRGHELRFVRQVLGAKAKDFADALSVEPETLSRAENARAPLSPALDKLLRAHVFVEIAAKHKELASESDAEKLGALLRSRIGEKDARLALYIEYRGNYFRAEKALFDFEFRKAA